MYEIGSLLCIDNLLPYKDGTTIMS